MTLDTGLRIRRKPDDAVVLKDIFRVECSPTSMGISSLFARVYSDNNNAYALYCRLRTYRTASCTTPLRSSFLETTSEATRMPLCIITSRRKPSATSNWFVFIRGFVFLSCVMSSHHIIVDICLSLASPHRIATIRQPGVVRLEFDR